MNALLSQLRLDALVAWRGRFVHATVGMAILFGCLLRFALPAQLDHRASEFVHDGTDGALFASYGQAIGEEMLKPSAEALRAAVVEKGDSIGVSLHGSMEAPAVTFVVQGHESDRMRAVMASVATAAWLDAGLPGDPTHRTTVLGEPGEPPPFGASWLPMLFGLDTVILGFFFAGVMVLQEKADGTVRCYRVTPSGSARYVASKTVVNTAMALVGAGLMVGIVAPAGLLNWRLFTLLAVAAAGLTLLAIGMSAWFDSLSSFFYPLAGVALLMSAPMVAYSLPSTVVPGMQYIPTHPVMFGARELLWPGGRADLLAGGMTWLVILGVVFAAFAVLSVDRRIMKEGR